jgi:hypothetical protein
MMRNFFAALISKFSRPRRDPAEQLAVAALDMTAQLERDCLDCDHVYRLLDEYQERAARGEDISTEMASVRIHLDVCPDCLEEYEMLERMVNARPAG